jgi:phospholipase C
MIGGLMEDLRNPYQAEWLQATAPEAYHSRREFLMKTAMAAGLTAGLGLALDPSTVIAEAARRQRQVALPSARNMPIDTIVVMMMENRSFDHYLGWLPGADGRQAGLTFTDAHGNSHETHRLVDFYQSCGFLDPDHSWDGGRTELDNGKMDGFLKSASDEFAIGYYTQKDLPFTPYNAQAFTAFDRFFCSILSSTYPNREYMHAAQSYGMTDNTIPYSSSEQGFPDTTIFNLLKQAGVSNEYYYVDIPFSALWGTAGVERSSQVQVFYEKAASGTLPQVCFVDPAFAGEDQGTSGDEHPLADVRVGQAWMADVVHACMESPQWPRMALFCIYDEWGGFFDHVVPPRVPDIRASSNEADDFGQMGFRIPAILVSPYARRGYVDHSIYGFESILKMIRYRFGLPPLTTRDLFANNIANAFDFACDPQLAPPSLPSPPDIYAEACPGTTPADTGGTAIDDGSVIGVPILSSERKPHDAYNMVTSGYLEKLGFHYKPATPATMFRHPSKLGLRA